MATTVPLPTAVAPVDVKDGKDWLRLTSGEWLRGKIEYLDRQTLVFDSEELDELKLDWDDVAEVYTTREFTVLFDNGSSCIGSLSLRAGQVVIQTVEGPVVVERKRLFRMVPGEPKEANYWSGQLSMGGTARTGNTRQLDYNVHFAIVRRTADSRLPVSLDTIFSETAGIQTTNNSHLAGQYDYFLTPRLFVTPLGVEFMRDPFQNTEQRVTPFAGVGYTFVDKTSLEWDGQVGLGYRYTRYDSVPVGESDTDEQVAATFATGVDWDINSNLELVFDYSLQLGLSNINDTIQSASLAFSVDLLSDLDLDIRLRWDRVDNPQPDSSGVTPSPDDFYLTLGLGWKF